MIEFKDVHLRYPYDEFEVLKGASFRLCDGVNTILCDVQSGKTSLCKLLIRQVKPTSGQILWDERDIAGMSHADLDILYLPAEPVFFERRGILYNIAYPLKVRKFPVSVRRGEAMALADRFGLDAKRKLKTLSREERKRLALARGATLARQVVLWDDFFDEGEQSERALALFDGAMHVIVTSDVSRAQGNTVVLDGGVAVYCGDAEGARTVTEGLHWLYNSLGSEQ